MRKFNDYASGINSNFIRDCWFDIDEDDLKSLKNDGYIFKSIKGDMYYNERGFLRGALLCYLKHEDRRDMVLMISSTQSGDKRVEERVKNIFIDKDGIGGENG